MKQKVLKSFIFKGNTVNVGDQIEIDEERLNYFSSQGLTSDVEQPEPEEKKEGEPPVSQPQKKRKKYAKRKS